MKEAGIPDLLKDSFESGNLIFPGSISHLNDHKKWVVYCKPPFDCPEGVLQFLGR
jgi:hypothetical protein